jgi:hypothetical protein
MSKPQIQNIGITCWEHAGKLGLTEPTICIWRSRVDLGQSLLLAVDQLSRAELPAHRSLTFKSSDRRRNITKIDLKVVPLREELRVMNIARNGQLATIEMTPDGLLLLLDAFRTWTAGGEDFGVSPRHSRLRKHELGLLDRSSGELWFWGPTMEP